MTDRSRTKWIGLVEVVVPEGSKLFEGNPKGGFVNVIALAYTQQEFFSRVRKSLVEMGFKIVAIEDVELYVDRIKHYEIDPHLKELAAKIDAKNPVGFATFHTYPAKDE